MQVNMLLGENFIAFQTSFGLNTINEVKCNKEEFGYWIPLFFNYPCSWTALKCSMHQSAQLIKEKRYWYINENLYLVCKFYLHIINGKFFEIEPNES